MHTVFALLCFVVVIHWLILPYPSGLLHWHCGNLTIAPVPAKQPWWIWINTSCELIMNDCITTTKQSTTKPCAYFLGYTIECVLPICISVGCTEYWGFANCCYKCTDVLMKWITFLQNIFSTSFYWMKNMFRSKFQLMPKAPIDRMLSMVEVMVGRLVGDKLTGINADLDLGWYIPHWA